MDDSHSEDNGTGARYVHWDYDRQVWADSLMFSLRGEKGPYVPIPVGCPDIGLKPDKIRAKTECTWYHAVGREIVATANYAQFTAKHKNYQESRED